MGVVYRVMLTREAAEMLRRTGKKYGRKTYETLRDLIRGLQDDPHSKGQPLRAPLDGYYSLHYSRFRVIYRIENRRAVVLVIGAGFHQSGSRKDIYHMAKKLLEKLEGDND